MIEQMNDEKLINRDMETAFRINERIVNYFSSLRRINNLSFDLPNIGIYYNNKMVELYNYLRKHNISYMHSAIRSSVNDCCMTIIEQAIKALQNFVDYLNKRMNKEISDDSLINPVDYLNEYEYLCNKLLNFSFEKDMEQAINNYIDHLINQEFYSGGINTSIDAINKDLETLDLSFKIEYRDAPPKWIPGEITDEMLEKMREELAQIKDDTNNMISRFC